MILREPKSGFPGLNILKANLILLCKGCHWVWALADLKISPSPILGSVMSPYGSSNAFIGGAWAALRRGILGNIFLFLIFYKNSFSWFRNLRSQEMLSGQGSASPTVTTAPQTKKRQGRLVFPKSSSSTSDPQERAYLSSPLATPRSTGSLDDVSDALK